MGCSLLKLVLPKQLPLLLWPFTYTCYLHVHAHTIIHALEAKRRKFLISLGTTVICNVLHCLCSCDTKELFISWFPCLPLPRFLEVFPRLGEVQLPQNAPVCICTFLWFRFISWQGGDHENCVNCDQWTQVTSIFLGRINVLHGTIPQLPGLWMFVLISGNIS